MVIISNLFLSKLPEFVFSWFLDSASEGEVCNDTCPLSNFIRKVLVTGIDLILWITVSFSVSSLPLPQTPLFLALELLMCIYLFIGWICFVKEKLLLGFWASFIRCCFPTAKVARRVCPKSSLPETLDSFQRKSLAVKLGHLVKILLKRFLGRCLSFLPSNVLFHKFQFFFVKCFRKSF